MKKLLFAVMDFLVVFFLAACGDDSGTVSGGSTKLSNADMEVDSYSQLPSCVEKREGKTAYVADQEQGYICQGGGWYESDAVETISAESRILFESSSSKSLPLFTQNSSGTMIDYRDGKTYKTVKIGSQTWMAENLKYDNGSSCNTKQDRHACDIEKKGCYYSKTTALDACPAGWHLPTIEEYLTLFEQVGARGISKYVRDSLPVVWARSTEDDDLKTKWDGAVLKTASDDWAQGGKGSDLYGFSLLPACGRDGDGECGDDGYCAVLAAKDGKIFFDNIGVVEIWKMGGWDTPVRCVKD